jgi:hypothetical protein
MQSHGRLRTVEWQRPHARWWLEQLSAVARASHDKGGTGEPAQHRHRHRVTEQAPFGSGVGRVGGHAKMLLQLWKERHDGPRGIHQVEHVDHELLSRVTARQDDGAMSNVGGAWPLR